MKITFLGTGSSRGIPRYGHADALCADARIPGSKSKRGRSSALIELSGANILIDVSPDFLEQAGREKISRISAIFLTHAHGDASGGLRQLGEWIKKQRHPPIQLFAPRATIQEIRDRVPEGVAAVPIKPFGLVNIAGQKIQCFPVNHGIHRIATFGYLFSKKLFYASDMDGAPKKTTVKIKGAQTLVLDGTFWERQMIRGHFTTTQSIAFAKKLNPHRLILTQVGHTHPPHSKAVRKLAKIVKKQNYTFPVQLAYDGLKIKL